MLSVAIICKNNEATIGRTLDSVAGLADEIVAVDSGSTDGTLDLLAAHGARVIETQWRGYVATKQVALEACAHEWVLALDSDESVEPDLRASIERALNTDDLSIDAWRINRKVFYCGCLLNHAWQPEHRVRLVRAGRARWTGLEPHDALVPLAPLRVGLLTGTLRHDSMTSCADFLSKQVGHARTMAQSMHDAGRRGSVLRMAVSPAWAFVKQVVLKSAWRDGWRGWVAAGCAATGTLMKHAILLELSRGKGSAEQRSDEATERRSDGG